jgi:hypothetical protein
MLPPGWPSAAEMAQAAVAAQFMAAQAQQLGLPLLPFPNSNGLPFGPPDFGGQFQGQNQFAVRPPSSSWERYSQQRPDLAGGGRGVTPPL